MAAENAGGATYPITDPLIGYSGTWEIENTPDAQAAQFYTAPVVQTTNTNGSSFTFQFFGTFERPRHFSIVHIDIYLIPLLSVIHCSCHNVQVGYFAL